MNFHALVGIELLHRLEQPLVADGDQLGEVETVTLIFLDVGDDESEVGGDEPLGGFLVAPLDPTREATLFQRVLDQRQLLDVLEVLIERAGRIGSKKRLGLASTRPGHSRDSHSVLVALWMEAAVLPAAVDQLTTAPI